MPEEKLRLLFSKAAEYDKIKRFVKLRGGGMDMENSIYIEAGRITNTHGVAGEVKIEVWLDSPEFMKKFRRVFVDGQELRLLSA